MNFRFAKRKWELLYTEGKGAKKFPSGVYDAFVEVMDAIVAAASTQDLRALRGLRFEQLKGDRAGQCSMRLNDQYRLIVEIEHPQTGEEILVIEIVDYH